MKNVLFISPHLDDVIISCGGIILKQVQSSFQVYVATVFTSPGEDHSHHSLYQKRRSDDKEATSALGVQAIHLDFTDAPFRSQRFHNFSTILFHHQVHKSDVPFMESVAKRLTTLIQELCPEEVWFPLGIGGHIDHHLVFESSKLLWNIPLLFNYYEDLPYALLEGWQAVRWQQLGASLMTSSLLPEMKKISLIDATIPFVHNYMSSKEDEAASIKLFDKEWKQLKVGMDSRSSWNYLGSTFYHKSCSSSTNQHVSKLDAISRYTTEWPTLFGPDKNNIGRFLKHLEHYWSKDRP